MNDLKLLVDEIKRTTTLPLTDYGASKLLAFPLSAVKEAVNEYRKGKDESYEALYRFCRYYTLQQDKKLNTDKVRYIQEKLSIAMSDEFQKQEKKKGAPINLALQNKKCDEVLLRSQARIKARNNGLTVGSQEYKAFIDSYISEHS